MEKLSVQNNGSFTFFCPSTGAETLESNLEPIFKSVEKALVEQCAPTLAGIKAGSLFRCPGDQRCVEAAVVRWDWKLRDKGIRTRSLHRGGLVYIYRPDLLSAILSRGDVRQFLSAHGFSGCRVTADYILRLTCLFRDKTVFPHVIGIFLGYPLGDVKGFIENGGKNFCHCGMWKVYGDKAEAMCLFDKFKKCTAAFKERYYEGQNPLSLAV